MFGASTLYKFSNIVNICSRRYSVSRVNFAQTYYEVLGLTESCTNADIKEAFYKKMKLLHPDLNAQNSNNHKLAVAVNEAYAVLGKSHSRENYDHYLTSLRQSYHNPSETNIPYGRATFRDRDHLYQDIYYRGRPYKEAFYQYRGSHNEDDYYGIKGLKRLPNNYIAAVVVMFMIFGMVFHYYISLISARYNLKKLKEQNEKLGEIYRITRENALKNDGNEKQVELLIKHLEKNPDGVNKYSKTQD